MSLISGNVTFGADAINCSSSSILGAAAFIDTASNQGTVSVASFSDTAVNEGTVVSAVFGDGAVNVGSLTSGTFLGTAVNSGVVDVAEFFGTASNVGVIVEAAKFADTSSNVGIVSGSAIFADESISDGVVEGAIEIAQTATQGENQALTETPTEYTQANGFFPNAHYSGGSKVAPANYATVVHQIGSFWYKYDDNGNGSLASGKYKDGFSVFMFVNGTKGESANPETLIAQSTTYYYLGNLENGIVLYQESALSNPAQNLRFVNGSDLLTTDASGLVTLEVINTITHGGDTYYYTGSLSDGNKLYNQDLINVATNLNLTGLNLNNDGNDDTITTNSSGEITITLGQEGPPAQGTFIRSETVYTGVFSFAGVNYGGGFANGTQDIVANGTGGEENGTYYPPSAGTTVTSGTIDITINGMIYNGGTVSWVTDGAGDFTQEFSLENGDIIQDNVENQPFTTVYSDGAGGYYTS
jgi:hypothetical protein